jgi:hypothetical protein
MKKSVSHQTTVITRQFKYALVVFAIAAGSLSAQAQYITGGQYLQNATTSGGYNGWSGAAISYNSTGIEVQNPDNSDYGGAYFVINSGVQTLNPADTQLILTFTLNGTPTAYNYFSPGQLVLNDANTPNSGPYFFNMPYFGYEYNPNNANVTWNANGSTYTVTMNIGAQAPGLLANIQAGNDSIYSFSLDLDPTGQVPSPWDITFNSIELAPVPEPASLALFGLGAAGLLVIRRRK